MVVSSMNPLFEYRPYVRTYISPLKTAHGQFCRRTGMLLRVQIHENIYIYGECAPLDLFGTETFEAALKFCASICDQVCVSSILSNSLHMPDTYPALSAGFSQLLDQLMMPRRSQAHLSVRALLASAGPIEHTFESKRQAGYRHFKLKIGMQTAQEQVAVRYCASSLMPAETLILDANGQLSIADMHTWLRLLQPYTNIYLEQPLPVGQEVHMQAVAQHSNISIIMDESVTEMSFEAMAEVLQSGCLLMIKPSILSNWKAFEQWNATIPSGTCMFSSAFETSIGIENSLQWVYRLAGVDSVVGYDTVSYFQDTLGIHAIGPYISIGDLTSSHYTRLWNSLA